MPSQLDRLHVIKATFDPGSNSGERTIAAHTIGDFLPDNAIIVGGIIDILETFTSNSATDGATIAVSVEGSDDMVAAIAISAALDVWDAGLRGVLAGSYAQKDGEGDTAVLDKARVAASYVKTSSAAQITVTVAVEALDTSAGKMNIFLYYYISE